MTNSKNKCQSNLDTELFALTLDPGITKSLYAQLADALRQLILSQNSVPGARLPASRALAEELSVSRMTVTTAFDQLLSEGYLVTRKGSGTFVSDHLPHLAPPTGRKIHTPEPLKTWLPFKPGLPDVSLFPDQLWARHLEQAWRAPVADLLVRPDPFGWYPLRVAISEHLSVWRGLDCDPQQIIVTSGAWDALDIICRSIFESGQSVAMEDPGWSLLRHALNRLNIKAMPVRIDSHGLDATQIPSKTCASIVTPSRHYPTGISMPLARRLTLLDWAKQKNALIIEDDYDSEFRYQGQPLPSLSGLDGLQHTIYLGSFSKLLNPALRIGYLVVPETLTHKITTYLSLTGSRASLIPQPALANFMDSGEFSTHLRRCRRTYARRQARLVTELEGIADFLEVKPDPSGMHLCCPLLREQSGRASDKDISALGVEQGLHLRALSTHSVLPGPPQGLLLGYAAFDEETLAHSSRKLTEILTSLFKT